MNFPAALCIDAYKAFHKYGYNPDMEFLYENYTNRFGKYSNTGLNETVHLGAQLLVIDYFVNKWNDTFFRLPKQKAVGEYKRVIEGMLHKEIDVSHMEALHDLGYLPLEVKSLPEGSLVPYKVPVMTVRNTVKGFGWTAGFVENADSVYLWGPTTSATTAFAFRKRFEEEESLRLLGAIPYLGHDFSLRGMFGFEAGAMSGLGHLTSFQGSDSIISAILAEQFYKADIGKGNVFSSVDATEHSVMCSYQMDGEMDSLEHLLTKIVPTGIISVVSDTWDFWKLVTEYLVKLREVIMAREGTLVIRPDSGDPVQILTGKTVFKVADATDAIALMVGATAGGFEVFEFNGEYFDTITGNSVPEWEVKGLIECLWDIFGGTIQEETGLKLLDSHIGAIYGDSINLERQDQIINRLKAKGFVPNVVLGIGSYTYQYVTRDTHGSAVKATAMKLKGNNDWIEIFKDPKTDDGKKKSAKGLLQVVLNPEGKYELHDQQNTMQEASGELKTIFVDGQAMNLTSLEDIRERINKNFQ